MERDCFKFPKAKNWLVVESVEELIHISRIFQLGYGCKVNIDECYVEGPSIENEEDKKNCLNILIDEDVLEDDSYTIKLSLPGTDRFFDATNEDITCSEILLKNAYGVSLTPENTQVKVENAELQELFDSYVSKFKGNGKSWGAFLFEFWLTCYRVELKHYSIEELIPSLDMWLKK